MGGRVQDRRGGRRQREILGGGGTERRGDGAGSLRDLRVAEVTKMDMKVENGKVVAFRTRVSLSFKYEA